jgi:hypothetical protein
MGKTPPEDLLIAARQLDREFNVKLAMPDWDAEHERDWRNYVPGELRRLWGRLDYETRVAVFVVAAEAVIWEDPSS